MYVKLVLIPLLGLITLSPAYSQVIPCTVHHQHVCSQREIACKPVPGQLTILIDIAKKRYSRCNPVDGCDEMAAQISTSEDYLTINIDRGVIHFLARIFRPDFRFIEVVAHRAQAGFVNIGQCSKPGR
jgi:hypothetical protein